MSDQPDASPKPAPFTTAASTVFDPLGRHHLSYARPPREKTFSDLLRATKHWIIEHTEWLGGIKRIMMVFGAILIFTGANAGSPPVAAIVICAGLVMMESIIVAWGRGL